MKRLILKVSLLLLLFTVAVKAQPALSSPTNAATGVSLLPTFTWSGGTANYTIDISANSDVSAPLYTATGITGTTYTLPSGSPLSPNTLYYWRITDNAALQSSIFSFTTGYITNNSPASGATSVALNPVLSWTQSGATTPYIVKVYADNAGSVGSLLQTTTVTTGLSTASGQITCVTAYNTSYWYTVSASGFTSAATKFTTIAGNITNASPANNATAVYLNPVLSWNSLGSAAGPYDVTIYANNAGVPGTVLQTITGVAGTSTAPGAVTSVTANNTIYWYSVTNGVYTSTPTKFTTCNLALFTLYSPALGTTVTTFTPECTWSASNNGLPPYGPYRFDLEYGTSPTLAGATLVSNLAVNKYTLPTLTASQTYYWRITVKTVGGDLIKISDISNFNTPAAIVLPTPVGSYPVGGNKIYYSSPTFVWYTPTYFAGQTYNIHITIPGGGTIDRTNLAVNYDTESLTVPGTYSWYVECVVGASTYTSGTYTFVLDVGQLPGVPTPSYPILGTSVYQNPPMLAWYLFNYVPGLQYQVQLSTANDFSASPITEPSSSPYISDFNYTLNTSLTTGVLYYWHVRSTADDGATWSAWSSTESFIVDPSTYSEAVTPVLTWPKGGVTISENPPIFYWTVDPYYTSLKFRVTYEMSDGVGGWINTVQLPLTQLLGTQPSSPLASGTYRWKVESTIDNGTTYGTASSWETFVVTSSTGSGIALPVLSWPIGNPTISGQDVQLSWYLNSSSDGLEFDIKYSKYPDHDTNGELNNADVQFLSSTTNNITLTGLDLGTTYYWQVRSRLASNPTAVSAFTAYESFTIYSGTYSSVVPSLPGVFMSGIQATSTPTLSWYLPTNPSSSVKYNLKIDNNSDMLTPTMSISDISATNYKVSSNLPKGTYYWTVVAQRTDNGVVSQPSAKGKFIITGVTGIENNGSSIPTAYELMQNYPNPFNPTTTIKFSLPDASFVTLKVFDILGREIKTLISNDMTAGSHIVTWNGDDDSGSKVASGNYIYRISAGKFSQARKMTLLK